MSPPETRSKKHQPRQGGPKASDNQLSGLLINGLPDGGNNNGSMPPTKGVKNGNAIELLHWDDADMKNGDEGVHRRDSQRVKTSLKAHHYDSRLSCKTW